ncbi:hypothetical protein BLNAU_12222 [Blattamonas nauphoetae]|uniref:Uncharacterized protein n=1 Tax=Blattamonas nauphoetae TaxID=2049346 RepID=A0ABQ9XMK6_9EUKA|nr:hypothetical protein BLNAU_12222 [Blattamonas nauphoetae]
MLTKVKTTDTSPSPTPSEDKRPSLFQSLVANVERKHDFKRQECQKAVPLIDHVFPKNSTLYGIVVADFKENLKLPFRDDDQKAPASPPLQTGKPNSQDWRNKFKKQKQQRREIVIARQEEDNARSPFECRFCDWFCSTAFKTKCHVKVCTLNPTSEKAKQNQERRRKHVENLDLWLLNAFLRSYDGTITEPAQFQDDEEHWNKTGTVQVR